jgi:hypothetical protein
MQLYITSTPPARLEDYFFVGPFQIMSSIMQYPSLGVTESKDRTLMHLEDIYREYHSQWYV